MLLYTTHRGFSMSCNHLENLVFASFEPQYRTESKRQLVLLVLGMSLLCPSSFGMSQRPLSHFLVAGLMAECVNERAKNHEPVFFIGRHLYMPVLDISLLCDNRHVSNLSSWGGGFDGGMCRTMNLQSGHEPVFFHWLTQCTVIARNTFVALRWPTMKMRQLYQHGRIRSDLHHILYGIACCKKRGGQ